MPTLMVKYFTPGLRLIGGTSCEPSAAEWDALVDAIRTSGPVPQFRTLILSGGGVPNLKQRKAQDEAMLKHQVAARTALLTDSAASRAVLTALGWVTKNQRRAFAPHERMEAFRHLEMTQAEIRAMQPEIEAMCLALGLNAFLPTVTKAAS